MSAQRNQVLVLGGPSSGKSTFLMQLYGRAASGECRLAIRSAPESLSAVNDGWKRLQQGLPPAHTPHGTDASLTIATVDHHGHHADITIPDYAGEDLQRMGDAHRISERWRGLASDSDHWVVMTRLSQHPDIPDLISRPVGELASAGPVISNDKDAQTLPLDLLTVELLQVLQHARLQAAVPPDRRLRLTLVLSCWDELDLAGDTKPGEVAYERLALLDSYCRARWGTDYRVVGLSSQGRALVEDKPDEEFIDYGPHKMGWLVGADGAQDPDLTKLIAAE